MYVVQQTFGLFDEGIEQGQSMKSDSRFTGYDVELWNVLQSGLPSPFVVSDEGSGDCCLETSFQPVLLL